MIRRTLRNLVIMTAAVTALAQSPAAVAQKPNIPGYYIGGYSGGNNRGGYAGYYLGGYPTMNGRGDAGGYYIGGYPAVDALAIPGPGYPRYGPGYRGHTTRFPPGYPAPYPIAPPSGNVGLVDVNLPADAELWFDGQKTSQIGSYRVFVTPSLQPGKAYSYMVRARWLERGRPVDQTREVMVRPGSRAVVDFERDLK